MSSPSYSEAQFLTQLQILREPWNDPISRYSATLLSDKYFVIPYIEGAASVLRSTLLVYDYQDCAGYEQNENSDLLSKPKLIAEIQLPPVFSTVVCDLFTHVVCQYPKPMISLNRNGTSPTDGQECR